MIYILGFRTNVASRKSSNANYLDIYSMAQHQVSEIGPTENPIGKWIVSQLSEVSQTVYIAKEDQMTYKNYDLPLFLSLDLCSWFIGVSSQ